MRLLTTAPRACPPPLARRAPPPPRGAARPAQRPAAAAVADTDHAAAASDAKRGVALLEWLEVSGRRGGGERAPNSTRKPHRPSPSCFRFTHQASGAANPAVTLASVTREGRPLDIVVAARDLAPGDRALAVPERLVITLAQVFEDADLPDLLSGAKKVSVLAQLALFLMYEKKQRSNSCWKPLLDELDRIQGRGPAGAKSPLLWDEGQAESLLAGSPVLAELADRRAGMAAEWAEADGVWFLASSFFARYPFDCPTSTFTFQNFVSAYCAVQAAVVHLMGVEPSLRFALVPLGPPLLQYSATSKATLRWDADARAVVLDVDAPVRAGDPVTAWCGPQPNR